MKVKVAITEHEFKALTELMNDAKVPIPMGYILGGLKYKILQEFQKAQESAFLEQKNKAKKTKTSDSDES